MDPRSLTRDFKEFLQCLNAHGVEYLLIGGHAVGYHGYPRATGDLDVWIAVHEENAHRMVRALQDFGFDLSDLSPGLFLRKERIIRMGIEPNQIEIQTGISGVEFSQAYPRRVVAAIEGIAVNIIALDDLKQNKQASGRYKDLADLENLP
ncbi:MAG TPA: hypothetical protein PKM43_03170 [Verrucomicrobiota bacterium]|nr:hypothetical protein [Verrucomicrobiota bacterium]HRZ37672.1 hypothetical protein [Candidatus Paceibacterota bacterium]HRZ55628.1 hypothetical protein [Candidatus Paceibacterota bacterium]